jgi:arginyl-tRNA synthetase
LLSQTLLKVEEDNDPEILKIQEEYTRKCTVAQFESCWRMNSFFDFEAWETDILHMKLFEYTVEKLKASGHIRYEES